MSHAVAKTANLRFTSQKFPHALFEKYFYSLEKKGKLRNAVLISFRTYSIFFPF